MCFPRPVLPAVDRQRVFTALHGPGIRASQRFISSRVRMASDIAAWCRNCQDCQRGKVTRHAKTAVQPIPVPDRRFSHLHVDLVGPLPVSVDGLRYLFTMVDCSSRWLEAVPLRDMETSSCIQPLLHHWIARFGVPAAITTDRGWQFVSGAWERFCKQLGVSQAADISGQNSGRCRVL
jgi:transposase InsO family protein